MTADDGLIRGTDGKKRCFWAGPEDGDYWPYHEEEWGMPTADDHQLYEKICLEGFQAGLSWLTVLRKRERFRKVFAGFDPARVACFGARERRRLLADAGIIRHAGKIDSAIRNAARTLDIIEELGSFAAYVWQFEPKKSSRPKRMSLAELRAITQSPESVALSKDLKRRGFSFVGPTTMYAFMQAMGMVDDHIAGCSVRVRVEAARKAFVRPIPRLAARG